MKTLSLTLGLLLLLHCCTAMPHAVNEIAPRPCCFKFSSIKIPGPRITNIIKTHSRCPDKGFVVSTVKGNKICVSQSQDWAQMAFEKLQISTA